MFFVAELVIVLVVSVAVVFDGDLTVRNQSFRPFLVHPVSKTEVVCDYTMENLEEKS